MCPIKGGASPFVPLTGIISTRLILVAISKDLLFLTKCTLLIGYVLRDIVLSTDVCKRKDITVRVNVGYSGKTTRSVPFA